ncbi:MAG TPA: hypothetical protein VF668_15450 [Pyrinomonadaceae bacterium]|jgi:hypothetical protein
MTKKADKAPIRTPSSGDPESWPGLVYRMATNGKNLFIVLAVITFLYVGIRLAGKDVLPPLLAKLGIQVESEEKENPVDFVENAELVSALERAQYEIKAVGCVVEKLESGKVAPRLKTREKLRVELVMSDPRGQFVTQRVLDEKRDEGQDEDIDRNKKKILDQINRYRINCREFLGDRLKVGVIDLYPTIEVFIIDEDLYAYPFPYRDYGSNMPVMRFKNYEKSAYAKPYKAHLDNIFNEVRRKNSYIEKIEWKTDTH